MHLWIKHCTASQKCKTTFQQVGWKSLFWIVASGGRPWVIFHETRISWNGMERPPSPYTGCSSFTAQRPRCFLQIPSACAPLFFQMAQGRALKVPLCGFPPTREETSSNVPRPNPCFDHLSGWATGTFYNSVPLLTVHIWQSSRKLFPFSSASPRVREDLKVKP